MIFQNNLLPVYGPANDVNPNPERLHTLERQTLTGSGSGSGSPVPDYSNESIIIVLVVIFLIYNWYQNR